jgi:hypothetical protein
MLQWEERIEIIDIECVLLSFLSKKIVCTKLHSKWRTSSVPGPHGWWMAHWKGHFGWSQTPEARNFALLQGVRIVFSTEKFAKKILYRDLKWKKSLVKKKKCLKTHSSGFFTKSNSSEQNICRNRHLGADYMEVFSPGWNFSPANGMKFQPGATINSI